MIWVIDNYDSFTYNLIDLLQRHERVEVVRNDSISLEDLKKAQPTALLISPGPGTPLQSRLSYEAVQYFQDKIPILGVCLGHQLLAEVAGARIIEANYPMHGKISLIQHNQKGIFQGISSPIGVMRYHSLIVQRESLPPNFEITAETSSGEIMAIQHKTLPLWGVQFHPESVLTEAGEQLMQNWLAHLSNK